VRLLAFANLDLDAEFPDDFDDLPAVVRAAFHKSLPAAGSFAMLGIPLHYEVSFLISAMRDAGMAKVTKLHATCRDRLDSITSGADLRGIVSQLARHKMTTRLATAESTRRVTAFAKFVAEPARPTAFTSRVDSWFVDTALAGLWPNFFKCAECATYRLARLRRPGARFCDDRCRDRKHRPAKLNDRREERLQLGRQLKALEQSLRKAGDTRSWLNACKRMRLTSHQGEMLMSRLMKQTT